MHPPRGHQHRDTTALHLPDTIERWLEAAQIGRISEL